VSHWLASWMSFLVCRRKKTNVEFLRRQSGVDPEVYLKTLNVIQMLTPTAIRPRSTTDFVRRMLIYLSFWNVELTFCIRPSEFCTPGARFADDRNITLKQLYFFRLRLSLDSELTQRTLPISSVKSYAYFVVSYLVFLSLLYSVVL